MTRWLFRHGDAAIATVLAYTAIGIVLGPGYFYLTMLLHGSGLIVQTALRR